VPRNGGLQLVVSVDGLIVQRKDEVSTLQAGGGCWRAIDDIGDRQAIAGQRIAAGSESDSDPGTALRSGSLLARQERTQGK
jgi:hypothetical protein